MRYHQLIYLASGLLAMTVGCAPLTKPVVSGLHVKGSERRLEAGDIVAMGTGEVVSFEALIADLSTAQVIYVGETHTAIADHEVQLRILKALAGRSRKLLVGMEMFPATTQSWLDRWSAGELSEEVFLKGVQWDKNWGYPVTLYRPILEYCRDRHIRIIALNAPPQTVRSIAQYGLEHLDPAERLQVAREFDRDNAKHRRAIREQYELHLSMHSAKGNFETFYDAQLAWEETMAEALATTLAGQPAPEHVVVLVGNGHIEYGYGVPLRAERRFPHSFKTVVPVAVNTKGPELEPDMADYLWITPRREPFHGHRGRLGVRISPLESGKGMLIEDVLPDGPAASAGVTVGDVLVAVDGQPVSNLHDIHTAIAGGESPKKPRHRLLLQRGGVEMEVEIVLNGAP